MRTSSVSQSRSQQQCRLGISTHYGSVAWTVDHRKNIEAANDIWSWLHAHSGLYVEPFEALLEEDFATSLKRRKEQGVKNLERFIAEDGIEVFRPWWTTATIHNASTGLLQPHRDKYVSQPLIFLNFEKTIQLCLQLVENGPNLKLPVASNQVVFLDSSVLRWWVEGVEEEQWAVTLTMGVSLLDDDNDKVKGLQWHGSSFEPHPIVEQVKMIPIKKI